MLPQPFLHPGALDLFSEDLMPFHLLVYLGDVSGLHGLPLDVFQLVCELVEHLK
jgi:hypothetical protein